VAFFRRLWRVFEELPPSAPGGGAHLISPGAQLVQLDFKAFAGVALSARLCLEQPKASVLSGERFQTL
jgi:hypothetical protein